MEDSKKSTDAEIFCFQCPRCKQYTYATKRIKKRRCALCGTMIDFESAFKHIFKAPVSTAPKICGELNKKYHEENDKDYKW